MCSNRRLLAQPPASAALPDDVIIEILVLLPARSIRRCRAVCKAWRSLATGQPFLRAHADCATAHPLRATPWIHLQGDGSCCHVIEFKFLRGRRRTRELAIELPDTQWFPRVLGSWDGIICIEISTGLTVPDAALMPLYVLFNPLTKACGIVPRRSGGLVAAYSHPVTSRFHLLHCEEREGMPIFRVLTVGGPAWREVAMPTCPAVAAMLPEIAAEGSPVRLHGKLHWLLKSSPAQWALLVFDMANEEFRSMAMPPCGDARVGGVGVLSGRLCILFLEKYLIIDVWELDDYEDQQSWRLKLRIGTTDDKHKKYLLLPYLRPHLMHTMRMEVVQDNEKEGEEILFHLRGQVALYNVRRNTWRFILQSPRSLVMHKESFVPRTTIFGAKSRILPDKYIGNQLCCCLSLKSKTQMKRLL